MAPRGVCSSVNENQPPTTTRPRVPEPRSESPLPPGSAASTAPTTSEAVAAWASGMAARLHRRRVLLALGSVTLVAGGAAVAGASAANGAGSTSSAGSVPYPPAIPLAERPRPASPNRRPPSPPPRARVATKPQFYVDDDGPMAIALTMDDGPHPVYTPQVLEVLRKYDVKATFNMIGEQVGANLSLVREVSAAGHTITNHTWNHADMRKYTDAQTLSEIDRCNDALAEAGQHPSIFRAPFGYWTKAVFRACAARDLTPVAWSVDPDDWDTEHVDTWDIVDNVLAHTRPHSIILEHDGGGVRRNTVAALKIFLPRLLDRGYHFVAM